MKMIVLMFLLISGMECLRPSNPWSLSSNECTREMNECRFVLRARSQMTMFYNDLFRVVADENGILSKYDNQSEIYPMEKIITADGYPKLV